MPINHFSKFKWNNYKRWRFGNVELITAQTVKFRVIRMQETVKILMFKNLKKTKQFKFVLYSDSRP
jgi:hypothetical protein